LDESRRYPPIGRCIYCDTGTSDGLSDEHIIALGLGGKTVLPKASCESCRVVTGEVERLVLRVMMGQARAELGVGSKRHKKMKKHDFPAVTHRGGIKKEEEVHYSHLPAYLAMFAMEPPGFLRGVPVADEFLGEIVFRQLATNVIDRVHNLGGRVTNKLVINPGLICRMLAKIAHAYAVAELGHGSFRPYLRDLILRPDSGTASHFVGGLVGDHPMGPNGPLHKIELWRPRRSGPSSLIAIIQLFAIHQMPIYQVVVGEMT
jgi:hypothetical protein